MKTLTNTQYIHALIAEGEHQQQDFKFEISDARKIAKTLSAFSNTDGGRLLIGVKDNGKIAGVRSDEEQYMIEAAARLYCRPEVSYSTQTYQVEGRSVLLVQPQTGICQGRSRQISCLSAHQGREHTCHPGTSAYLATKRKSPRRIDEIYRTGAATA